MVMGTGLIGGSVGMALRGQGWYVSGTDATPGVARRAVELGALDAEGDDLLLDAHQHAAERLLRALAVFRLQSGQPGNSAQFIDECVHILPQAGHEHVDALRAQQNRAFQPPAFAMVQQPCAQVLQSGKFGELIAGDVGDRGGGWHGRLKKHMNGRTASANSTCSAGMAQCCAIENKLAISGRSRSIPGV